MPRKRKTKRTGKVDPRPTTGSTQKIRIRSAKRGGVNGALKVVMPTFGKACPKTGCCEGWWKARRDEGKCRGYRSPDTGERYDHGEHVPRWDK